ncbi:hypothetical protein Agub_g2021 [Astrephomene gubernaculifera]|uniref:Transmembrane protein n=1 Tax=Astrephomene gubernaculifera TaxID=47775 RepID=A0AAD3DGE5_9CHLO|nr:hypothetical protein Agub_g2021 [Astrephomene gubernaculifera]
MASFARQRSYARCFVAFAVLGLVCQAQGRLLIIQQESRDGAHGVVQVISDEPGQASSSVFDSVFGSSFSWLQQQLTLLEELERATIQRLTDSVGFAAPQYDVLRDVGRARMRAALLDRQLARQSSAAIVATSTQAAADTDSLGSSSSATSSSALDVLSDMLDAYDEAAETAKGSDSYDAYTSAEEEQEEEAGEQKLKEEYEEKVEEDRESEDYEEEDYQNVPERLEAYDDASYDVRSRSDDDYQATRRVHRQLGDAYSSFTTSSSAAETLATKGSAEEQVVEYAYVGNEDDDDDDDSEEGVYEDLYEEVAGAYLAHVFGDEYQEVYEDYLELRADPMQMEWEDYLDLAYEYDSDELYGTDGDWYDSDEYVEDYYLNNAIATPNGLAMLADIAELVAWTRLAASLSQQQRSELQQQLMARLPSDPVEDDDWYSGETEVRSFDLITFDDISSSNGGSSSSSSETVFIVPGEPFGGISLAAVFGLQDPQQQPQQQTPMYDTSDFQPMQLVNKFDLQLVHPDGSINWGLVTLCILAAGTAAMLAGMVVSCAALRRSMLTCRSGGGSWVYVPARLPRQKQPLAWCGSEELSKPLVLSAEESYGTVVVEHAARYVPPVEANESVAKALYK